MRRWWRLKRRRIVRDYVKRVLDDSSLSRISTQPSSHTQFIASDYDRSVAFSLLSKVCFLFLPARTACEFSNLDLRSKRMFFNIYCYWAYAGNGEVDPTFSPFSQYAQQHTRSLWLRLF